MRLQPMQQLLLLQPMLLLLLLPMQKLLLLLLLPAAHSRCQQRMQAAAVWQVSAAVQRARRVLSTVCWQ
jgi:hypothetical protein